MNSKYLLYLMHLKTLFKKRLEADNRDLLKQNIFIIVKLINSKHGKTSKISKPRDLRLVH